LSIREIPKVVYAPYKAFKEIIQNPKYTGPLLIMILFIIANIGFGYALLSKRYIDQTQPQASNLDKWTEETDFWASNANITLNTQDYINGTYYGSNSIQFDIENSSSVWIQLNISDSVSCSGHEGYKFLSFRIKLESVEPPANPSNVSLYIISSNMQGMFYQDMTNKINQTGVWINSTVAVGEESSSWLSIVNANWSAITGLKLDFTWPTESNITLLVDGIFFHGLYKSGMELSSMALVDLGFPYSPLNAFMQFTIQWVILGGLLYLIPKMFQVKTIWKPLLIIAGFILIIYFIRMILFSLVIFASPEIKYTFEYLGGVSGEWENAINKILQPLAVSSQILWFVDKFVWVWTVALCATALHLMFTLPWTKSILASITSFALYLLLLIFFAPVPPILL